MRVPNWPIVLNQYIIECAKKEFEWGVFDCCIFAADAVLLLTGEDKMEEFRGTYSSEESAKSALSEIGHGNLYKTLYKKFGGSVPGVMGKRGDIGFYEGTCGIIVGRNGLFLREGGFAYVPLTHIPRAFQVV